VSDRRNGLTSWSRPSDIHPSGVSFRDRVPEQIYRYVLVHELGHYLGLDHAGHDGAHLIMFTADPGEGLTLVTPSTLFEYLLLTGEPRFTVDDARTAWAWIASTARECLR
jgi:hypothetical protein